MQSSRDRLIELIQSAVGGCARHWAEKIADYLLEHGVIVPLDKADDYNICGEKICYLDVNRVEIYKDEIAFVDNLDNYFFEKDIHDTVFLTREEAEKKLAERSKDNE